MGYDSEKDKIRKTWEKNKKSSFDLSHLNNNINREKSIVNGNNKQYNVYCFNDVEIYTNWFLPTVFKSYDVPQENPQTALTRMVKIFENVVYISGIKNDILYNMSHKFDFDNILPPVSYIIGYNSYISKCVIEENLILYKAIFICYYWPLSQNLPEVDVFGDIKCRSIFSCTPNIIY